MPEFTKTILLQTLYNLYKIFWMFVYTMKNIAKPNFLS